MGEGLAICISVGFGNGKAGASDRFFDAEALSETTYESGLAGTDIADKLNNMVWVLCKPNAEIEHFLFRRDFHCIIIA